jgi:hypothetical protein
VIWRTQLESNYLSAEHGSNQCIFAIHRLRLACFSKSGTVKSLELTTKKATENRSVGRLLGFLCINLTLATAPDLMPHSNCPPSLPPRRASRFLSATIRSCK